MGRSDAGKMTRRSYSDVPLWVAFPAMATIAILFFLPLIAMLSRACTSGKLIATLTDPYLHGVLRFTVWQALLSTLASLAIGLPGAWIMATYKFPAKRLFRAVCTVPYVLPSILVVLGFVIFYGNNGFLNRVLMRILKSDVPPLKILYSLKAIILAHAFYNFPLVMHLVSTAWSQLDPHPEEAALTLGASRFTVFYTITLPRLMGMVASSALLVFLYCYGSFSIILVLGGGPAYTTMESEIYRYAKISLDMDKAATLACISLCVALVFLLLYLALSRHITQKEGVSSSSRKAERKPEGLALFLLCAYACLAFLFVLGPIASVIARSFITKATRSAPSAFSTSWYQALFAKSNLTGTMGIAQNALSSSLLLATLSALISIPVSLSLVCVMRKEHHLSTLLELFCMLPLAVSSVMVGVGYLFLSSRLNIEGYIPIVAAHLVVALPVSIRTILPCARTLSDHYIGAAHTLGAGKLQCFLTIELPLLRSSIITGTAFAFAMSLGELNATLTLAKGSVRTIPIAMYQLIGSYNYQGACALASVLIAVSIILFWLNERLRGKESLL